MPSSPKTKQENISWALNVTYANSLPVRLNFVVSTLQVAVPSVTAIPEICS